VSKWRGVPADDGWEVPVSILFSSFLTDAIKPNVCGPEMIAYGSPGPDNQEISILILILIICCSNVNV
jgi:hypothetical protein